MTKREVIKVPNAPQTRRNPLPVGVRMGNQDSSRAVMIPDDSIPIVEDGKIIGHRVEAKK
jgi:hypothetical protein